MQVGYCGDANNSSLMILRTSWMPTAAGSSEIWKSATVDKPSIAGTSSTAELKVTAGSNSRNKSNSKTSSNSRNKSNSRNFSKKQ
jgi:hypothetical protein